MSSAKQVKTSRKPARKNAKKRGKRQAVESPQLSLETVESKKAKPKIEVTVNEAPKITE